MSRPRPVIDLAYIRSKCVEDGDCLLWRRTQDDRGRPKWTTRGDDGRSKTIQPRRVVWTLAKGSIPEGLLVTVTCGNKLCLNCEHMELITKGEVIRRTAKNPATKARRRLAGLATRDFHSKLDMDKARYIRHTDKTLAEVASELGIGESTASAIRRGKRWKESNPFAGLMG
jgi:hypothetical protein